MGLISSGGGKFPHRLLSLEGRPQEKSGEALTSRIRFVNALPDGVLEATIPLVSKPIELSLKPGESSEIVPIKDERFPGATLNYSLGATKKRPITKIPPMPKLPQGDWVVVVHLDQESFDAPVLTWVEMDQGSILSPDSRDSGE